MSRAPSFFQKLQAVIKFLCFQNKDNFKLTLQPNIEDYLVIIVYLCLIFSFSKLNYQKVGNHEKNSETILKKKYGKKTSCSNTRIASWFRFPIPKNGFRYALTYFQFLPRPQQLGKNKCTKPKEQLGAYCPIIYTVLFLYVFSRYYSTYCLISVFS